MNINYWHRNVQKSIGEAAAAKSFKSLLAITLYLCSHTRIKSVFMTEAPNNTQKTTTHHPGEKLKDKIHRHLSDKNDIITEEDIRDSLNDNKPPEEDSTKSGKTTK
jgi:hypothetical protein